MEIFMYAACYILIGIVPGYIWNYFYRKFVWTFPHFFVAGAIGVPIIIWSIVAWIGLEAYFRFMLLRLWWVDRENKRLEDMLD